MEDVFNSNGEPVTAFSEEEMTEAQKTAEAAKLAEIQSIKDDAEAEKADLQEKYDEAVDRLGKVDDKSLNFKNLRTQKETAEQALEKFKGETNTKLAELTTQLTVGQEKLKVDSLIDKMSAGDVELQKKIRFHYDSFTGTADTDEKLKERLDNAYVLAVGHKQDSSLPADMASSGGGKPPIPKMANTGKLEDTGSSEVAHNLGISDEELKTNKLI